MRWSSSPEAFAIDGLPVDRFVVEPAPRFEKKLAASLGDDDELAREVVAWISAKPALVAVDRLEAAGAAAVVLAPGGTEAFARKVAAAHEGQGRAPRGQIDHLLVGEGRPRFVLALSVADIVEFVHGVLPPDLLGGLPREAGRELGDIAVVGRITGDATWEMDLQVGQPTLDLVRALW